MKWWTKTFVVAFLFGILFLADYASANCGDTDKIIMGQLKDIISGILGILFDLLFPGWNDQNPCNWDGVMCSQDCVIQLTLTQAINGILPAPITNLVNLEVLKLDGIGLTQSLPSTLSQLVNLKNLSLKGNALTGILPDTLSALTELVELDLSNNQLSGSVANILAPLTKLEVLDLSHNNFDGPIANVLNSLSQASAPLLKLNLRDNAFDGPLPTLALSLPLLHELDLGDNLISGTIPAQLFQLVGLEKLWLDANELVGRIPFVKDLVLSVLNLGDNLLCGTVPPALRWLDVLELTLSDNCLSEPLPNWCKDDECSDNDATSSLCSLTLSDLPCTLLESVQAIVLALGPTKPILTFPDPPGFAAQITEEVPELFHYKPLRFLLLDNDGNAFDELVIPRGIEHDYYLEEQDIMDNVVIRKVVYSTVLPNGALAYFEHYLSNENFTLPFGSMGEIAVPREVIKSNVKIYDWPISDGDGGLQLEASLSNSDINSENYDFYEQFDLNKNNSFVSDEKTILKVSSANYNTWATITLLDKAMVSDGSVQDLIENQVNITHEYVVEENKIITTIPHTFSSVHYDPSFDLTLGGNAGRQDKNRGSDDQWLDDFDTMALAIILPSVAVPVVLGGALLGVAGFWIKAKGISIFGGKSSLKMVNFATGEGAAGGASAVRVDGMENGMISPENLGASTQVLL